VTAAESAYEQAVRLLARREHSRRELSRKLAERDFPEAEREAALDRLEREGLQSDARFAEEYARMRLERGFGPRRVESELAEHGVAAELRHFAQLEPAEERERAAAALHKRFGESPPASKKEWARRMRFLEGRGFSPELCRPLVGGVDADES
jgi:regulatory protein